MTLEIYFIHCYDLDAISYRYFLIWRANRNNLTMSRTLQWCNWRQKVQFFLQLKVCILFLLCSILCFLLSFCFSASYKLFQIIRWAYKNIKKAYYFRKYFNLKKTIMSGMSSNRSQIYFELTKVLKTS